MTAGATAARRDAAPAGPGPVVARVGPQPVVVEADALTYRYGSFTAVREVDLSIAAGEVFALLGTNGAGKTTLLDLVQGYRRPAAGIVRVLGTDPLTGAAALRRRTGAVLQQAAFLPELTVTETVRMCAELSSRRDDVAGCLQRVGLSDRADVAVAALSGGERRRLDIATATWGGPDLLVMDEPTTGLDPASRRAVWQLVRDCQAAGTAILLTTHYLEEVEQLADRVAIMHQGTVAVCGTLAQVIARRPALLTAELDAGTVPPAIPGLTTTRSRTEPTRTAVRVECTDLQDATHRLTTWAAARGVRLHDLRATSARLEDVFHAVPQEEL